MVDPRHVPSASPTARCAHCGAVIPVVTLVDEVHCPFCRQPHQIDPKWLMRARGYASDARERLVELAELQHESARGQWPTRVKLAAILTPFVLGVMSVANAQVPALRSVGQWMAYGMTLFYGALIIGFIVRSFTREGRSAPAAVKQGVSCRGCGATNERIVGQPLTRCSHCGGSMLAGSETMLAGFSIVSWERRREQAAVAVRERRRTMLLSRAALVASGWPLAFLPVVFVLIVARTAGASWELTGTLCGWTLVLVPLLAILTRVLTRAQLRARLHAFGHRSAWTALHRKDVDTWLRRHWVSRHERRYSLAAFSTQVNGYPVLIDFGRNITDLLRVRGQVLLATWNRDDHAPCTFLRDPAIQRLVEHVRSLGFELSWIDAGLRAASSGTLCPQSMEAYAAVVPQLSQIARTCEVPPAPDLDLASELELSRPPFGSAHPSKRAP